MIKVNKICLYIITGVGSIGVVIVVISSIFAGFSGTSYSWMSDTSTIISIVLAVISIIYTFYSGEETNKGLGTIAGQSKSLVDKIRTEKARDNYDEDNIKDVLERDL